MVYILSEQPEDTRTDIYISIQAPVPLHQPRPDGLGSLTKGPSGLQAPQQSPHRRRSTPRSRRKPRVGGVASWPCALCRMADLPYLRPSGRKWVAHFVWGIDRVHGPPHTKPVPPESTSDTGTFAQTLAHQAMSVVLCRR